MIIVLVGVLMGCGQGKATPSNTDQAGVKTSEEENSQAHFKQAGIFWDLIHESEELRKRGEYRQAINTLENAYDHQAFGRSEKTIALEDMAIIYELMNDYQLAANFYEGAAKMTMNPNQAQKFNNKADLLKSKVAKTK